MEMKVSLLKPNCQLYLVTPKHIQYGCCYAYPFIVRGMGYMFFQIIASVTQLTRDQGYIPLYRLFPVSGSEHVKFSAKSLGFTIHPCSW